MLLKQLQDKGCVQFVQVYRNIWKMKPFNVHTIKKIQVQWYAHCTMYMLLNADTRSVVCTMYMLLNTDTRSVVCTMYNIHASKCTRSVVCTVYNIHASKCRSKISGMYNVQCTCF